MLIRIVIGYANFKFLGWTRLILRPRDEFFRIDIVTIANHYVAHLWCSEGLGLRLGVLVDLPEVFEGLPLGGVPLAPLGLPKQLGLVLYERPLNGEMRTVRG